MHLGFYEFGDMQCRNVRFELTQERDAVGAGVRNTVMDRFWRQVVTSPTSYLLPTSQAFLDSQAGNAAYHWPAQSLGQDSLNDLPQLGQAICMSVAWGVSAPLRLPQVVVLSMLHGVPAAKTMLQPAHLAEYSQQMYDSLADLIVAAATATEAAETASATSVSARQTFDSKFGRSGLDFDVAEPEPADIPTLALALLQ